MLLLMILILILLIDRPLTGKIRSTIKIMSRSFP